MIQFWNPTTDCTCLPAPYTHRKAGTWNHDVALHTSNTPSRTDKLQSFLLSYPIQQDTLTVQQIFNNSAGLTCISDKLAQG